MRGQGGGKDLEVLTCDSCASSNDRILMDLASAINFSLSAPCLSRAAMRAS